MLLYSLILFLHVAGALGIGAALGIEWTGVSRLRRATTMDSARTAMSALLPLRYVGGVSMLLLLASGIYMTAVRWRMQPWIVTALLGMVAMGALGGAMSGKRYGGIGAAMAQARDALDGSLRQQLLDHTLLVSLHVRTGILASIVMLMTVRPGWAGSVGVLLVGGLLGLARSMWGTRQQEVVAA